MYSCFVFLLLVAAVTAFKSKTCGGDYAELRINDISDPLILREGQTVHADFRVDIRKVFPTSVRAKITLKRKVWFAWVPVPCFSGVGSCTHTVTCDMINKMQAQNGGDIQYPCPSQPRVVSRKISYQLPKIPGAVSTFGGGDYFVRVEIQSMNGHKLACAEGNIRVKT
ncbi:uncharacterized protein LOC130629047 [Hydractinia symbiolongicarpus]|uniref:uncharacterized protein LOC130629047 n=1 Tax=Hydractinia symbiolongicarpus TaxID=13093 RepID=UPI002550C70D|nr:uncharacterized protein LOC130629047 [Hydractinia symbiolongicarpus]